MIPPCFLRRIFLGILDMELIYAVSEEKIGPTPQAESIFAAKRILESARTKTADQNQKGRTVGSYEDAAVRPSAISR